MRFDSCDIFGMLMDEVTEGGAAGGGGGTDAGAPAATGGDPAGGATGTSEGGTTTGGDGDPGAAGAGGEGGAQTYTPNFKFKYRGVEKDTVEAEFDEMFRPLVKDAESEKKVRDFLERAYGIDFVKHDRDQLKAKYEPLETYKNQMSTALAQITDYVRRDDIDSFLGAMKIPKEQMLKWALKQVELSQMTPEQRQAYEASRAENQRVYQLENQNQQLQQNLIQLAVNQKTWELDRALEAPAVAEVAAAYGTRMGAPDAFKNFVIERGKYYASVLGIDKSPAEVVQEVVRMLGAQAAAASGQGAGAAAGGAPGGVAAPKEKPVMTNIAGKGTSPAKKVLTSTDQIRALAQEMGAR